jgi:hypothetical protein
MDSGTDGSSSKQIYDTVVGAVRARCNDVQGPGARKRQLYVSLAGTYGRFETDDIDKALRAGRERGDLCRWRDGAGTLRYTPIEEDELQDIVGYMNDHEYDPEQIERIARLIREVRDDD